jgi:hypothetical protein
LAPPHPIPPLQSASCLPLSIFLRVATLIKKENQIFLIYKETQSGAVAKSYMRKGFQIYEEFLNLLIFEENLIFFFISIVELTDGGRGEAEGRAKSYDSEKAWFSINHSIFYGKNHICRKNCALPSPPNFHSLFSPKSNCFCYLKLLNFDH